MLQSQVLRQDITRRTSRFFVGHRPPHVYPRPHVYLTSRTWLFLPGLPLRFYTVSDQDWSRERPGNAATCACESRNGARATRLASNPGFPFRILSRSFEEKSEGKPGRISHVIRWHRDVNLPAAKAIRHTECSCYCVWGKKMQDQVQVHGERVTWRAGSSVAVQQPTG